MIEPDAVAVAARDLKPGYLVDLEALPGMSADWHMSNGTEFELARVECILDIGRHDERAVVYFDNFPAVYVSTGQTFYVVTRQ